MLKKGNRANTLHGILLIVLFSFAAFYIAGFRIPFSFPFPFLRIAVRLRLSL